MGRLKITETIEIGNRITGVYGKWSKKAEFEDASADEVIKLIKKSSSMLFLPCSKDKGMSFNSILSNTNIKLLKDY